VILDFRNGVQWLSVNAQWLLAWRVNVIRSQFTVLSWAKRRLATLLETAVPHPDQPSFLIVCAGWENGRFRIPVHFLRCRMNEISYITRMGEVTHPH
jgi:hypothetical protein